MDLDIDFILFERGYWDSVQFGYIPDFEDKDQMISWYSGIAWGRAGKGHPCTEQLESGEIKAFIEEEMSIVIKGG